MKVTFLCPSTDRPVGGNIALYHFANALARRGHDVAVAHLPLWGANVTRIEDIGWFRFEATIEHAFSPADPIPVGDVAFGTGAGHDYGLPVLLLQGIDMLHPWLERSAIRTPALRLCVASWLVEVGAFFGVERDRFSVVPCGIDHGTFRVLDPAAERPIDVAVLVHHHEAKGWAIADATIRRLQADRPGLRIEAFGAGDPHVELPAGITYRSSLDHRTLARELYGRTKVFLQTSWYEGFGFTAVEAMACGAALVTTDNGGSRDYGIDGATALVTRRGDVDGLIERVTRLLDDPAGRADLAERGRAHATLFDWDRSAGLMERALEDYVAHPERHLVEPGPDRSEDPDLAVGDMAAACLDGIPERDPGPATPS